MLEQFLAVAQLNSCDSVTEFLYADEHLGRQGGAQERGGMREYPNSK